MAKQMQSHSRYGITAQVADGRTTVSRNEAIFPPASVAAMRAAQLHALLTLASGDGATQFSALPLETRDHLVSMAADMAGEIRVLCKLETGEC